MRFERYDRIAHLYSAMWPQLSPGYAPTLSIMLEMVRSMPTRPKLLLDIGCGPASATLAVASACHAEAEVTLVDGSAAMLRQAQEQLGAHVRVAVHGDFTDAAVAQRVFAPATHELALCSFALHHLENSHKVLTIQRLATSIRPGGVLLLADEVAVDRPGGWDVVERVRGRLIQQHLRDQRISPDFWQLETSMPPELHLPFKPARVDELISWMAHAGFAASCPLLMLGSALVVGVRGGQW